MSVLELTADCIARLRMADPMPPLRFLPRGTIFGTTRAAGMLLRPVGILALALELKHDAASRREEHHRPW
jgi:hypothetical protein